MEKTYEFKRFYEHMHSNKLRSIEIKYHPFYNNKFVVADYTYFGINDRYITMWDITKPEIITDSIDSLNKMVPSLNLFWENNDNNEYRLHFNNEEELSLLLEIFDKKYQKLTDEEYDDISNLYGWTKPLICNTDVIDKFIEEKNFSDLLSYLKIRGDDKIMELVSEKLIQGGYWNEALDLYELLDTKESHYSSVELIDRILIENDEGNIKLSEEEYYKYNEIKYTHLVKAGDVRYADKTLDTLRGLPWTTDDEIHNSGDNFDTVFVLAARERELRKFIRDVDASVNPSFK